MLVHDGAMPVIMHNQNHLPPNPHFKFTFTNSHHTPNPKGLRPIFLQQFTLTVSGRGLPLPNRGFYCAFLWTKLTDAFTAVWVNGPHQKLSIEGCMIGCYPILGVMFIHFAKVMLRSRIRFNCQYGLMAEVDLRYVYEGST